MEKKVVFWAEKSSLELEKLIKEKDVVMVPLGSTEQHGPHLPVGTDHINGWEICKRVAEKTDALLLPMMPFGFSEDHWPRTGTISLSASTLIAIVKDTVRSLVKNGVKYIILVSCHAGQLYPVDTAMHEMNLWLAETGKDARVCSINTFMIPAERLASILEEEMFVHGEELETSWMLLFHPELVKMEKAVKEIPEWCPKGLTASNMARAGRLVKTKYNIGRDLKTGILGDATLATKEKGERLLEMAVDTLVQHIEDFKMLP